MNLDNKPSRRIPISSNNWIICETNFELTARAISAVKPEHSRLKPAELHIESITLYCPLRAGNIIADEEDADGRNV